jgi:DNA-binding transcriptional regulator YiaG
MAVKPGLKYFPLYQHLKCLADERIKISFTEIERILDTSLPVSAYSSRSFWSNRIRGGIQAAAWLEANYRVVNINLAQGFIIFQRPFVRYTVRREGIDVRWDADMIRALRAYLDVNQQQMAEMLGVRQQTVSEWETSAYTPTRSRSKYLTMVAEQKGFYLGEGEQDVLVQPIRNIDKENATV